MSLNTMTTALLAVGDTAILLNPVTPVLTLAAYAPYAWLISSKIEKDATAFNLNKGGFGWINPALMAGGIIAVAVGLLVPFAGWLVTLLIEAGILVGYWKWRDKQVPAGKQFRLSMISKLKERAEERKAQKNAAAANLVFLVGRGEKAKVPGKDDPLLEVHQAAERVIGEAIAARASRTQIQSLQGSVGVVDVVDAIISKRDALTAELGGKVMDYIKKHAGLDVNERRRRQVGKVTVQTSLGSKELTITTSGSTTGQSMRIDFNRDEQLKRDFADLGFTKQHLALLEPTRDLPGREGIILLCAPTGFGLTTMAYAMLSRHDAFTSSVKTLERSVDLRLDGVDQLQFDSTSQSDFATTLRSIIRRGPDVVFASDVADPGTAKVISDASGNQVLTYVGLPVDGVQLALAHWIKAVGSAGDAARGLKAVVSQRLLRVPCPACKIMGPCSADQAKRLGLPAGKTIELARASGKVLAKNGREEACEVCRGTGYFGLTGIHEVMPIDDEGRKLLSRNDIAGAYQHARRNLRMMLMQESALMAVRDGRTTVEDVARAFAAVKPATPAAGAKPAAPATGAKPAAAPGTAKPASPAPTTPAPKA
jgi:type II secretory ATPase GspE/PulE/Tfp pilus assembly ATPase PilB-like protein